MNMAIEESADGNFLTLHFLDTYASAKLPFMVNIVGIQAKANPFYKTGRGYVTVATTYSLRSFLILGSSYSEVPMSEVPQNAYDQITQSWNIAVAGQHRFQSSLTDNTPFTLEFSQGHYRERSGALFFQIRQLMKMFGIYRPSDLEGISIDVPQSASPLEYIFFRSNLLARGIKVYEPPPFRDLYERATNDLLQGRAPNFEDVDSETVFAAFQVILDDTWVSNFKSSIHARSQGKVKLIDVNETDVPIQPKTRFYILRTPQGDRKVILVPAVPPIVFLN